MATKLSRAKVNAWRLSRHHLVQRSNKRSLAKVVSDVCGIQAQVLSAAELALRARIEGLLQEDVRQALWKKHTILRTWGMRGTLHLLTTSELPLFVAALREKLANSMDWLLRNGGIEPSEVEAVSSTIGEVLMGQTLSREELAKEVARRVELSPQTRRALMSAWGVLLSPAAYQGNLAFGENIGPKVTFANPRNWIRRWEEPTSREAMAMLFRRYLVGYGPAAPNGFAHWWGGPLKVMEHLEPFAGDIDGVEFEGIKGLMLSKSAEEAEGLDSIHGVSLLPSFDSYVMFYSPRDYLVPDSHRKRIFRQTAGWNYPAVVVDGVVAGAWRLNRRGRRIEIVVEGFRTFEASEKKGIAEEVEDLGRFYQAPSETVYGSIG